MPDAEATLVSQLTDAVCLGVTVLTGAPISDALRISRAAKRRAPDLPVVWGGWHPSMFGIECLAEPCVDVTVQGQGEATFAEIVERLAAGDRSRAAPAASCACPTAACTRTRRDRCCRSKAFARTTTVSSPSSATSSSRASASSTTSPPRAATSAARSVPIRSSTVASGSAWSRSTIATALRNLWERYRFTDVNFQDETFFTKRERVRALAESMVAADLQITWAATMRADQGIRLPEDVWRLCKHSGLRRLLVGVESGDKAMLKRIRKDITLAQVFETAERMRELGHRRDLPLHRRVPRGKRCERRATIDCAKRLRAMSPDFETPIFYFKPYPGSAIVARGGGQGLPAAGLAGEWARFDYVAGEPGPWVNRAKFKLIERFKFFQELAWKRASAGADPLQRVARYRCRRDDYRWPIEMVVLQWLQPRERLS